MMDVFYIQFRKKDELTTNNPLVDGFSVPNAKLQVDPAKRSYANVARCAYALPQKCPNPSKTKR